MNDSKIEIVDIEDYPECGTMHEKPDVKQYEVVEDQESRVSAVGICQDEKIIFSFFM